MATFDFKQVRADLKGKVQELRALVTANDAGLTDEQRARYAGAIEQMEGAHTALMQVDCDPPNMSFEFAVALRKASPVPSRASRPARKPVRKARPKAKAAKKSTRKTARKGGKKR